MTTNGRDGSGDGTTLVDVTDLGADEWDALAVRSPHGHAFQSHAWGELKRPLGWDAIRLRIDIDGRPAAAVSLQTRRASGALPRGLASLLPAGLRELAYVYAPRGPIVLADDPATVAAAISGLRGIAARIRAAILTVDPSWPAGGSQALALSTAGFTPARRAVQVSRTGMVIPLGPDEAAQHERLGSSTANRINKAERSGVRVEEIDLTDTAAREPALVEFYAMLEATGRRQDFLVRDRDYQIDQWRALGEAGNAFLWFAVHDGRRRCATICLRCGKTLLSYNSGAADDADLGKTSANHLLQWEIVRWALGNGFTAFDMGGVDTQQAPGLPRDESHPLWNLMVFKRGFGAEGVEYLPAYELVANPAVRAAWSIARRLR